MNQPLAAGAERSSLSGLLLLSIAVIGSFAMFAVFMPLQEAAKADLGLSDFQIGLTQGIAAAIPVTLLAIPLGRLVDSANRVRMLLMMGLLWSAGVFVTAFSQGFVTLFIGRMINGVAMTFTLPLAISLAADWCAPTARGRALLLLSIGRIFGTALGFALGGALLGAVGQSLVLPLLSDLAPWRSVHVLYGIASLALCVPLLLLREPQRREISEAGGMALRPALQAIRARRQLLLPLFVGQIAASMAAFASGVWISPVLTRDYGLQPEQFGSWIGGLLLLSGLLGSVLGGLSADWGYKGRIPGGILIGAVVAAIIAVPASLYALMPDFTGCLLALGVLQTSSAITGLVTATAIAVLIPNDLRGVCMGVLFVVGALVGTGLAPTLVTLASDAFGGEAQLRYGLSAVSLIASVLSAIGFVAAARAQVLDPQKIFNPGKVL